MSRASVQTPYVALSCIGPNVRALVRAAILPLSVATLFVSSALLALIEPMFAKMALPLLGGSPAVWNTCLVFFQAVLLIGYAYGHGSTRRLPARRQAALHVLVLLLPLALLPVAIPHGWSPPVDGNPVGWLLLLLTVAVGLPYFAVSTSAPVIQRWFATTEHPNSGDPYFLYAAASLGSMLGLLAYPCLIEPFLAVSLQCRLWMWGYFLFVGLTACCALYVRGGAVTELPAAGSRIAPLRRWRWILLAFIPSSQLLGVTAFITSDIAAVPLFWIVPLALYFLSFILVFSSRPLLPHRFMVRMLPVAMASVALFMAAHVGQPVGMVLAVHLVALFVSSMVCHGELAADRPPADKLTDFYLTLSLGGVCGGLFNALLAPLLFKTAAEYPIAVFLACLVCPMRSAKPALLDFLLPPLIALLAWGLPGIPAGRGLNVAWLTMLVVGMAIMPAIGRKWRFAGAMAAILVVSGGRVDQGRLLAIQRSFFGIHRIVRVAGAPFNDLYHGTTVHGSQHVGGPELQPIRPDEALTYYYRTGPIGQLLTDPASNQRIGVVGLGVGSLAAYAGRGTHLTYYEIDPAVRWAAEQSGCFTFLSAARARGADVRIIMGDARLTLRQAPDHSCDVLVLDAFSGDAVPVHLLTRQAMRLYQAKLAAHGRLAMHISNMYLDLLRVTAALASDGGWVGFWRDDLKLTAQEAADGKLASQWVVMARSLGDLGNLSRDRRWQPLPAPSSRLWTDDFSDILSVFRWRGSPG